MSSSKVKQAIDEVIGDKPLLNDPFVYKVLNNKKKRKTFQHLQPTIVLLCAVLIAFVLYIIPANDNRTASIELGTTSLTVAQHEMVQAFYEAIHNKDPEALMQVTFFDSEWLIDKYQSIDLRQPIKIIRTVDFEYYTSIYVKLMSVDGTAFVNELTYNKMDHKIHVSWNDADLTPYEVPEFPEMIFLNYSIAGFFSYMEDVDASKWENYEEPLKLSNGMTVHFIKSKDYMQVLETKDQQYINLNTVFSNSQTFDYIPYGEDVFLRSHQSGDTAFIHKHSNGEYQIEIGMVDFENDIEPYLEDITTGERFILFETDRTWLSIVKNGELLVVNLEEQANLKMPYELYSFNVTENKEIVLTYKEDDFEKSATYVLDESDNLIRINE